MRNKRLFSTLLCIIFSMFFIVPVSADTYSSSGYGAEQFTSLSKIASQYADGWHKDSYGRYFYTEDDVKLTGWNTIDGNTYYFDSDGSMYTGWLKTGSDYYYLKSDGTRATNTTLTIDGKNYSFDSSGKNYIPKTTSTTSVNKATVSTSGKQNDYILNTNTKKFHKPGCRSVNQMKDKNKKYYTGTRDEVIDMGYDPCKNCNP